MGTSETLPPTGVWMAERICFSKCTCRTRSKACRLSVIAERRLVEAIRNGTTVVPGYTWR